MYHKWKSHDVWFLRYGVCRTEPLSFWTFFCLFPPPNNLKNQHFEKMKKIPRDSIILHMCTINDNNMMNDSWDIEHDGHNFLSFWTIFCTFTSLTTQKIKHFEKMKKTPGDTGWPKKSVSHEDIHKIFNIWPIALIF